MKNFIALIFIFILGMQMAFAETLPPKGYYDVKPEDYPILFGYVEDYANKLFEDYNPSIFWAYSIGEDGIYFINNDGSLTIPDYLGNRHLKKLILKTPPPPFPKELKADKIKIDLGIFRTDFTDINIYYSSIQELVHISLSKDHQWKFWFKKKK